MEWARGIEPSDLIISEQAVYLLSHHVDITGRVVLHNHASPLRVIFFFLSPGVFFFFLGGFLQGNHRDIALEIGSPAKRGAVRHRDRRHGGEEDPGAAGVTGPHFSEGEGWALRSQPQKHGHPGGSRRARQFFLFFSFFFFFGGGVLPARAHSTTATVGRFVRADSRTRHSSVIIPGTFQPVP